MVIFSPSLYIFIKLCMVMAARLEVGGVLGCTLMVGFPQRYQLTGA
jgi:hypothetical protein